MEKLSLNSAILMQIFNDSEAINELQEYLNCVIDEELSKGDSADCDLIDDCINALEELELESSEQGPHLTALLSEEKFIKGIQRKSVIQKDRYRKLAVICASAVILFAAGSVKTQSGQTVAKKITNKIASVFSIENFDPKDEENDTAKSVTETTAAPLDTTETTTEKTTENLSDFWQEPTTKQKEKPVYLEKIYGVRSKKMKTEYKLGEDLDLSGLQVFAVYSNGDEKQIPIDDCTVSIPKKFGKDVGSYKVTVAYQEKTFSYDVKVYAEKNSAVLNSIYGTFPDGFSFKTDSFDDMDFTGITVTAVYSDGTEKEIPLSECGITVEKNFMELENKALVTVSYEERSFSFVMTREEQ